MVKIRKVENEYRLLGVGVVGREADQHLVEDNAEEVPVDCLAMALLQQDLRGKVGD